MANEHVVEYGVAENGTPWIITEEPAGPGMASRTKYEGDQIPDSFAEQIKREHDAPAEKKVNENYDAFTKAHKIHKPIKGTLQDEAGRSKPDGNQEFKFEKGKQETDAAGKLHPSRQTNQFNQVSDVQVNANDTYQPVKEPEPFGGSTPSPIVGKDKVDNPDHPEPLIKNPFGG